MRMRIWTGLVVVLALAAGIHVPALDAGSIAYWSAEDLTSGKAANLPFLTTTHAFNVVRMAASADRPAESHEGTTDVLFVVAGGGSVTAGGEIEKVATLKDMPGEMRGPSIKGGTAYELAPGATINIPPSTPYRLQAGANGLVAMRLKINAGMHPWSIVSTQQTTLQPAGVRAQDAVPLNVTQGGVVFWSAESLHKAHATMKAAAAKGESTADPRGLAAIPATRTHAWNFLYRIMGPNGRPPGVEFHEGNTDIYFILDGTGTVMTEGTIENREPFPNRPGETRGTLITGGRGYKVKAGDVINMPPSTPHQSLPDPGGFTYLLVKVNVGMYPWSLIDK